MFAVLQAARITRLPIPGPVVVVVLAVVLSALFDFRGRGIAVVGDIPRACPRSRCRSPAAPPSTSSSSAPRRSSSSASAPASSPPAASARAAATRSTPTARWSASARPTSRPGCSAPSRSPPPTRAPRSTPASAAARSSPASSPRRRWSRRLYLQPALRILPIPALGAILVAAALSLIDVDALREIWRISRMEFVFALIALLGPISLGVLNGVIIAIGATLAYLLHKMMYPRDAMLGRIPGRDGFYKLHRRADARPVPGLAICLIQGSLLFFNADHVQARLRAIADALPAGHPLVRARRQRDRPGRQHRRGDARGGSRRPRRPRHRPRPRRAARRGARPARTGRLLAAIGPGMVFDDLDDALRAFEASGAGQGGTR